MEPPLGQQRELKKYLGHLSVKPKLSIHYEAYPALVSIPPK